MVISTTEIFARFPDIAPYLEEVRGCPPEIFAIDRDFRGKSWRDVDAKTCVNHSDALVMMDTKPLKYFLPAFLVAALELPKSVIAESFVSFVCSKSFDTIAFLLDTPQHEAVLRIVETLMDTDQGYFASQTDCFLRKLEVYARAQEQE